MLTALAYSLMNMAAFKMDNNKKDESSRKSELMMKIFAHEKPDIIFIGSSTTKYHISTNIFKKDKLRIFNYGLEGHFFTAYPSMIDEAIKAKPKIIAISLHAPELYFPLLSIDPAYSKDVKVTKENLRFYINHYLKNPSSHIELQLISRMLENYIIQHNYLCINGYKVTDSIKRMIAAKDEIANRATIKKEDLDGDGIIMGIEENLNISKYNVAMRYKDKKYSYVLASYINAMFDKIRAAGIKPVLILIPQFENSVINMDLIRSTIHGEIVDMNTFRIPVDNWYNGGHLNVKGRQVYSERLMKEMKRLV